MCRGSLLTSGASRRCSQAFEVFSVEILPRSYRGRCYSAGTGPRAWEEGRMWDDGRGQLRWAAGWQPQPKASPQPQQGNLISCFRDSVGLRISFSLHGNEQGSLPRFQVMCLISLSEIGYVEVWKLPTNGASFSLQQNMWFRALCFQGILTLRGRNDSTDILYATVFIMTFVPPPIFHLYKWSIKY